MNVKNNCKTYPVEAGLAEKDIVWLSPKDAPFSIHGLCETHKDLPYHRLPVEVAQNANPVARPGVAALNWNTAGGRVRFATNSRYIAIKAVMPETATDVKIPKTGQSGFDLYRYTEGTARCQNTFLPQPGVTGGYESITYVPPEMTTYSLNMPLYDGVNELYIGLAPDAEILPAAPYTHPKPILYYGSSITQGACASRPGNAYQAFIEREFDTDYINLGFSGSALGEEAIANHLATIDASIFVCDYDHNAFDPDYLQSTHYALYKTYRTAHKDTPIVLISKPDFRPDADTLRRREIISATYRRAMEEGDDHVYYIDGENLLAGKHRDSCTVDGCHPNDLGFYRMSQVIGEVVGKLLTI